MIKNMKINLNKHILDEVKSNEEKCVDCMKCYKVCPMMKDYSSSPKSLMKDIISESQVDRDIPYSCMLCGACTEVCPKDIDLKSMFHELRKEVFNNKAEKPTGYNAVKFHQINSFSPVFCTSKLKKNTKKVFLPGCSLTSYSSELVEKTFEYLKETLGDIYLDVNCCGKPTESMGDMEKFEKYFSKLENKYKNSEVEEVIVACPNCFSTIRKYSSNVKVTPIWEIISEFGIPKNLVNNYSDLDMRFTLHDPCPMRSESKVHNNVREILNSLGVKVEEFEKNRENSQCCGSGGMVRVTNPDISNVQTNKRANEAKTETIISYCESCCESMLIANKKSLHVLDFLFNKDVIEKKKLTQEKTSTLNKWSERYKGARLGKLGGLEK